MQFAIRRGLIVDSDNDFQKLVLSDVFYALSREYRFASNSPYSVLHHSVALGIYADKVRGLWPAVVSGCVTHDFQEAFVRDIPSQVKKRLTGYEELERELYEKLMRRFGISNLYGLHEANQEEIWRLDKLACAVELASFTPLDRTTEFLQEEVAAFSKVLLSTRCLTYEGLCEKAQSMLCFDS